MSATVRSNPHSRAALGGLRPAGEGALRPAVCPDRAGFEEGSFGGLLDHRAWTALELMGRAVMFPHGSVLMYAREPGERVMVLFEGRGCAARGARAWRRRAAGRASSYRSPRLHLCSRRQRSGFRFGDNPVARRLCGVMSLTSPKRSPHARRWGSGAGQELACCVKDLSRHRGVPEFAP